MRTSKKDINYLSISENQVEYFSGSDNPRPGTIPVPPIINPAFPENYDAILKISNSTGIELYDVQIAQGRENTVDCNNHARNCIVKGFFGINAGSGDQVFTVKGGSHDLEFAGTILCNHKKADVVVGEWSDQSYNTSYNLDFSGLKTLNGAPVTFIFSRVNSPIMAAFGKPKDIKLPPNAKVRTLFSLAEQIYWWTKWLFVKTGIIKFIKI